MPFTDTSVKWVTDEFRGAAVINGQPGSLLAAIRQFINGWGDLTPVSVTVTGGIATAELPVLSSFEKYSVISISGNTDLNGEARISDLSGYFASWPTAPPNPSLNQIWIDTSQ